MEPLEGHSPTAGELRSDEFRARIHRHAITRLAADLRIQEEDVRKAYELELVSFSEARVKDFVPILATERTRRKLKQFAH